MKPGFPAWIGEVGDWEHDVIFVLDRELRFVDCNPAWDEFAADNGGVGISRAEIQGRSVLDYVPEVLRTFYVHKYWYAMRAPEASEFDYNCSSPEKIRLFCMTLRGMSDGLLVVNRLRLEEECAITGPLTDAERPLYLSAEGFVTMCANCRKTKRRDDASQWVWIPELLNDHSLTVSHGLCPRCMILVYG